MLERRKRRRGAGGSKDCKCGKWARGASQQSGRTRKRSAGKNRIWWKASPQGTKYTGPRHASTSARGGDSVVSVHSDLPSHC
eukprot:6206922-Pleurochrysis_carterae.AAC.1